jgi:hypothetical protein
MDVGGRVFDHTHYVPILRWKMGEKRALKALFQRDKERMTPLVEWSRLGDVAPQEDRETPTPTPPALAQDILKHWGARPFFCDLRWFWAGNLDGDSAALRRYAVEFADGGIRPIPVLSLNDDPRYRNALAPLTAGRGVCVRLAHSDLTSPHLSDRLNAFLSSTGYSPAIVHLVADFEVHYRDADTATLCSRLSNIALFRTFTVAAGSFPMDLREFKGPQVLYLPREEWLRWHDQVTASLPRRPAFADYGTLHPVLTPAKRGLNPSASIRYTTEDHWLVMKGEGLHNEDGPGYEQYKANAALLMQRRDYCGPEFSAGDRYISYVTGPDTPPGNLTTWVQVGVNHHMTFVVRQIAELFQTVAARGGAAQPTSYGARRERARRPQA